MTVKTRSFIVIGPRSRRICASLLGLALSHAGCAATSSTQPDANATRIAAASREAALAQSFELALAQVRDGQRVADQDAQQVAMSARRVAPAAAAAQLSRVAAAAAARERFGPTWTQALPKTPSPGVLLEQWRAPKGSHSLGSTSQGSLIGAKELKLDGPHYSVVSRARDRQTRYGSPALVDIIMRSAVAVAKAYPKSTLAVGNLSYQSGGDIRWSVSHNSGRDADLAFYVKDLRDGSHPVAPDLISFDDEGKPRDKRLSHLRFDVPRNWALAKALITSDAAQLQYLFISDGLKQQLIDFARAQEEPAEIIARADELLRQPTDSSPHDDHFHLRLTCTLEDRLLGCTERGPRWSWVDWYDDELLAVTLSFKEEVLSEDVARRREAWRYLAQLQSPYGAELALSYGVYDADPEAKQLAQEVAMGVYSWSGAAIALTTRYLLSPHAASIEDKAWAYRLLRKSVDARVPEFVLARLDDPATTPQEQALALDALSHQMLPELVPPLIERLKSPSEAVRAKSAQLLARITNFGDGVSWEQHTPAQAQQAYKKWSAWWEEHSGVDRQEWLRLGFAQAGLDAKTALTAQGIEPMMQLLLNPQDHLRYNANAQLRAITGRWASLEQSDGKKLLAYWSKWWKKNKHRAAFRSS